jgi:glycosyltransferase involved in cell wall biosynthesis
VRWVSSPVTFVLTALLGAVVDLAVLGVGLVLFHPHGALPLLGLKVVAVAVAAGFRALVYRSVLFNRVRADLATRVDRGQAPGAFRLTVVVPAYREEARIGHTVERLRTELADLAGPDALEIVVVDDGSGDGTADAAQAAGADQVLRQPRNLGKGAAVRAGMMVGRGRTIAFTDADLAYPPGQLMRLLAEVEQGWDVVVGNRHHRDTDTLVEAPWIREVGGRIINRFTYAVLLGHHRDTQCGIKAFRSDVARLLFAKARIDGFAFDVEIFHLVERYHLSLTEVPVAVENSTVSTVHVARDASRLIRDLLRVLRGGRKGWYDLDDTEARSLRRPSSGTPS